MVDEPVPEPAGDPPSWTTVVVDCGPAGRPDTATAAEVAADRLWRFGPAAVEEREV